jgi:hypothetical protein
MSPCLCATLAQPSFARAFLDALAQHAPLRIGVRVKPGRCNNWNGLHRSWAQPTPQRSAKCVRRHSRAPVGCHLRAQRSHPLRVRTLTLGYSTAGADVRILRHRFFEKGFHMAIQSLRPATLLGLTLAAALAAGCTSTHRTTTTGSTTSNKPSTTATVPSSSSTSGMGAAGTGTTSGPGTTTESGTKGASGSTTGTAPGSGTGGASGSTAAPSQ